MKYVLTLALVVLAVWLWLRAGRRKSAQLDETVRRDAPPSGSTPSVVMRRCAHCGVHVPQTEVIAGGGDLVFCSVAHRAAGPR
jgi:uncharacterized protein